MVDTMADEEILLRLNIIIVLLFSLLLLLLFSALPPEGFAFGIVLLVLMSPAILWSAIQLRTNAPSDS